MPQETERFGGDAVEDSDARSAGRSAGKGKTRRKKRKRKGDEAEIEGPGRRKERKVTRMQSKDPCSQLRYVCGQSLQRHQRKDLMHLREKV